MTTWNTNTNDWTEFNPYFETALLNDSGSNTWFFLRETVIYPTRKIVKEILDNEVC
jgi:hypothetical protein